MAGGGGQNGPWTAVSPGCGYIGWVGTTGGCFGRLAVWQGTGRASSPEPVTAAGGRPTKGKPGGIDCVFAPAAGLEVVVGGATVGSGGGGGGIFMAGGGASDPGGLDFALCFWWKAAAVAAAGVLPHKSR